MEQRVGQRPRAAHLGPERRRPLVLDAALGEFVKHGYRGTSMEAIADAAKVSKPVVYECYPSKEKLFRALLEREERKLGEAVAASLPRSPSFEDVEAVLAEGLTALLTAAAATPLSWRVVFDAEHGGDEAVLKRVLRARAQITKQLTTLVALFLEQAGTKDIERKAPVLAELLAGTGRTSVRLLLDSGGDWTPEELGAFVARVLARGAGAA
ncbi:MAG: TetR/AcrR family transcriptional regulator [Thermoleophilaceae bacterium]|jgi:AcrR family transcriptional regulator